MRSPVSSRFGAYLQSYNEVLPARHTALCVADKENT